MMKGGRDCNRYSNTTLFALILAHVIYYWSPLVCMQYILHSPQRLNATVSLQFPVQFFSALQALSCSLHLPSPPHALLSSLILSSQFLSFAPFHSPISFLVVCPHLAHHLIPPPQHSVAWLQVTAYAAVMMLMGKEVGGGKGCRGGGGGGVPQQARVAMVTGWANQRQRYSLTVSRIRRSSERGK